MVPPASDHALAAQKMKLPPKFGHLMGLIFGDKCHNKPFSLVRMSATYLLMSLAQFRVTTKGCFWDGVNFYYLRIITMS